MAVIVAVGAAVAGWLGCSAAAVAAAVALRPPQLHYPPKVALSILLASSNEKAYVWVLDSDSHFSGFADKTPLKRLFPYVLVKY